MSPNMRGLSIAERELTEEIEQLKVRIKELEDKLANRGWDEKRPRYDSYGQFDGYYP